MKNPNRTFGNYVITDGTHFYSWIYEKFMSNISDATGYNSKKNAMYVIGQIKSQFPNNTLTVIQDK